MLCAYMSSTYILSQVLNGWEFYHLTVIDKGHKYFPIDVEHHIFKELSMLPHLVRTKYRKKGWRIISIRHKKEVNSPLEEP